MMPLLNAAEAGDVHQVQLLLDHGANIEERNYYGLTALHRASEEGRYVSSSSSYDMHVSSSSYDMSRIDCTARAKKDGIYIYIYTYIIYIYIYIYIYI